MEHDSWGNSGTFPAVVGTDYAYPLSGVRDLFTADDFTFVNLECALTDHTTPAEKEYRFRGPPAYGQILKEGGVDAVSLANNHSLDYGTAGLQETRQVLSDLSIAAGGDKEALLYTTDRGLKIGVYTAYHIGKTEVRQAIESLRQQGAQVIIAAFHMGTEGSYTPTAWQREICRYAAECGAQIVYNSHPHVLQPMERWGESVILYSMGNFCFGGNRNPSDKDTAVVQVSVQVQADGTAELGEVTVIPCSVSSRSDRNDYRPTPCGSDSAQAARVRSKLDGTFRPPAPAPAGGDGDRLRQRPGNSPGPVREKTPRRPAGRFHRHSAGSYRQGSAWQVRPDRPAEEVRLWGRRLHRQDAKKPAAVLWTAAGFLRVGRFSPGRWRSPPPSAPPPDCGRRSPPARRPPGRCRSPRPPGRG